jgi:hypothetical protein
MINVRFDLKYSFLFNVSVAQIKKHFNVMVWTTVSKSMNIINLQSSFTNILKAQLFKNLANSTFYEGSSFQSKLCTTG